MAQMTLPAAHTEADARLAERIGCALGLDEVHVFWTLQPQPAPERESGAPPAIGGLAGAIAIAADLLGRVGWRLLHARR